MTATRALAVELYHQVRSRPGNQLISPYSVWLALAMLIPGARGPTHAALARVLAIDDVAAVRALAAELARRAEPTAYQRGMVERGITQPGGYGFHLDVANKLWVQTGYRIKPEYAAALADAFAVDPSPVDFAGAPDAACDAINRWVDAATRGRIPSIVSPPLPGPIRGLLANAIYFKAAWADEFNERGTSPRPFKLLDGGTVDVPTMWRTGGYGYAENDGVIAVQLHYIQPDVAMVVIAPPAGRFADFERELTADRLDQLIGAIAPRQVDLKLPKFRFETSLSLAAPLRAIGLGEVLSPAADLSGVSDEAGFGVGEVLHKTFIAVDEKGTEAAAVTAVMFAGAGPPPKPTPVTIDRPFYVMIRDIPTRTLLFFGRVVDPR